VESVSSIIQQKILYVLKAMNTGFIVTLFIFLPYPITFTLFLANLLSLCSWS